MAMLLLHRRCIVAIVVNVVALAASTTLSLRCGALSTVFAIVVAL